MTLSTSVSFCEEMHSLAVYKESVDYAEAVGKELKENVYQALETLAQGFLKTPENDLKEIHLKEKRFSATW